MVKKLAILSVFVGLAMTARGCTQDGLDAPREAVDFNQNFFRCYVQPVLVARCSFMECHGSEERPYKLYAVQRLRRDLSSWDQAVTQHDPLTEAEVASNYNMSVGFAGTGDDPPLLVMKPLDVEAGGYFHKGKTLYGNWDVFTATDDIGYQILEEWVNGATAPGDCAPTEEVGR